MEVALLALSILDFGYSFQGSYIQIICCSLYVASCAFSVVCQRKPIKTLILLLYYVKEQLLFGNQITWPVLYLHKMTGVPTIQVLLVLTLQIVCTFLTNLTYQQFKPQEQQALQIFIIFLLEGYLYREQLKKENIVKHNLINEISKEMIIKLFDNECNQENQPIPKVNTENTFIFTPRNEQIPISHDTKEVHYKLYINQEQMQSGESNQQQLSQKIIIKSSKELIQYLKEPGRDSYFILGVVNDHLLNVKMYYRVVFRQLGKQYSLIYLKFDNGIFLRQNQKIIKYKQNLVNIFNHKLKTPLNSAIGHLITAKEDEKIPETIKQQYLAPALLNCRLQLYLTQDILDYIQCEFEQLTLMTGKVNIQNLLTEVYDLIEFQCKIKRIQIQFRINSENWRKSDTGLPSIYTDSNKLIRVLLNLLNNSYRFTEEGGWILLEIRIDSQNKVTHFTITDSGVGMSEEQIEKLNSQLKQYDSNISNKLSNKQSEKNIKIGLSLYLASKLVKLLSGDSSYLQARIQQNGCPLFAFSIHDSSEILSESQLSKSKHNSFVQQRSLRVLSKFTGQTSPKISKFKQQSSRQIESINTMKYNSIKLIQPPEVIQEPTPQIPSRIIMHNNKQKFINQRQRMKTIKKQIEQFRGRATSARFHSFEQIFRQTNESLQQSTKIAQEQFILIVDDEPFNHETLCMMLKSQGFQHFLKAFNGQQCLDIVEKNHANISMILMDIDMPIMNGIEATKQIEIMICNNTISYIPIIGCTAHEDYESHLQCFNAGMIHVVVKPVFIKSLQEAFSRIQELKFSETIREQADSHLGKSSSSISK